MIYYTSCMNCPYRERCEKVGSFDKEIDEVVAVVDDLALVDGYLEFTCNHLPRFCGHRISSYGLQEGYVDYNTLSEVVGATVLCNDLIRETGWENWEQICGPCDYACDHEIFQFYLVPARNVNLLEEANEIVYYNEEFELYLWGITHYGTGWSYVLTEIEI